MSTNKLSKFGQKLLSLLLLVLLLSLIVNFFRQVIVYRRISRRLAGEEKNLITLEQRNKELKEKLEELNRPDFSAEKTPQAISNFWSVSSAINQAPEVSATIPNYEKWKRLFFY